MCTFERSTYEVVCHTGFLSISVNRLIVIYNASCTRYLNVYAAEKDNVNDGWKLYKMDSRKDNQNSNYKKRKYEICLGRTL